MRDGEDDGIGARSRFGNQSRHNGNERSDDFLIADSTDDANGRVRSPHADPERDVEHGHFSYANLSALGIGVGVRSQRGHVHLGGLCPQFPLVVDDGPDDVVVAEADDQQRGAVVGGEQRHRVRNRLFSKHQSNEN